MERSTFAQALKAARQASGLSQGALAERAQLTAPYVSLLESGRRRPPRPEVIERLAQALGTGPEVLLELAALERTPSPIRKRLEGMDRERSRVQKARDGMLSTTLFHLARNPATLADMVHGTDETAWLRSALGRVGGRLKGVRSAREARARSHEVLDALPPAERDRLLEALPDLLEGAAAAEARTSDATSPDAAGAAPTSPPATLRLPLRADLATPTSGAEGLHVDASLAHRDCFLWRLRSDEGYPRLEAGDLLLVDPTRTPVDGDLVALRHGAQDLVRVLRHRAGEVRLEALRTDVAPLRLAAAAFAPIGVILHALRSF